jgi:hypothetical protein
MLISLVLGRDSVNETKLESEREYGLDDKVGVDLNGNPMTVRNWTEEWWKWLLGMKESINPYVATSPHLNTNERMRANQPNDVQTNSMKKVHQSVWFFAAPPYGVEGQTVRAIVPYNWSILASPYNSIASPQFYPSHNTHKLLTDLNKEDLDGVYELYATLDGTRLIGCRVDGGDRFFTAHLPPENIFDGTPGKHDLVQDGHWVFLKPLPPGDHWLHLHGYSKNYQLDIKCHLMVQAHSRYSA